LSKGTYAVLLGSLHIYMYIRYLAILPVVAADFFSMGKAPLATAIFLTDFLR